MLAIIGGSGVGDLFQIESGNMQPVTTKYGTATLYRVQIFGEEIIFLPRHGASHSILPHLINHQANIAALKMCGVERILAICAAGSLRKDLPAGSMVLPDDFLNAAGSSLHTFFAAPGSAVVHTDMSNPYCPQMRNCCVQAAEESQISVVDGGTYVGVLGPRYETAAEVRAFAMLGGDIVGMTGVPECALSREAGICYSSIAIVTNYATGLKHANLEHTQVAQSAHAMKPKLHDLIEKSIPKFKKLSNCCAPNNQIDILEV